MDAASDRPARDEPAPGDGTAARARDDLATGGTRDAAAREALADTARRHARFGWWALLGFLSLGLVLEALHGFKLPFYVDGDVATRRHMWTLAHAHGTLLALVQIAFATTLRHWPDAKLARARRAGGLLLLAALLMPLGFFLGGLVIYSGDPGLGILLVPAGGLALLLGVLGAARGVSGRA